MRVQKHASASRLLRGGSSPSSGGRMHRPTLRPSQAYDINGDGVISLDELERSVHERDLLQTKFHLYQFFTLALAIFLFFSLACNFGVVYGVVQYTRQTSGARA